MDHPDDTHIIFGPNFFRRADKLPWTIKVDRCLIGPDDHPDQMVTLGWNEWGGQGIYYEPDAWDFEEAEARVRKWAHYFPMPPKQYRVPGDHCTIIGEYPSPTDDKKAIEDFYLRSVRDCTELRWKVHFRPHPQYKKTPFDLRWSSMDDATLYESQKVYTYKSTFGVKCRLQGLPVMADSASMAAHHPDDDEAFRRWLVFSQWHIKEIASGEWWEYYRHARSI